MAHLYISSTYQDLRDERGVVWSALKKLRHDAVGMEAYAAADARPVELCLKDVRECDGYVGIIGARYGWRPEGYGGKSITQLEYEEAGRHNLPCLIFHMAIRPEQTPEPGNAEFRERTSAEHTPKPVPNIEALEAEVMAAVFDQFGSGREVPALLPYLCDRGPQMSEFKAAFEASYSDGGDGRPLLVLVHGGQREAHGKLIERIYRDYIPRNWNPPGRRSCAVKSYVFDWPAEWRPAEATRGRMLDGLSFKLGVKSRAELVVDGFAKIPGLCLVQAHVLTDDCRRSGAEVIAQFVDFWERLPLRDTSLALIVTLSVKYKSTSKLRLLDWNTARLNKQMESVVLEMGTRNPGPMRITSLPKLPPVIRNWADQWADLPETRRFIGNGDLGPSIREMFEKPTNREEMSMEELAQKLTKVLTERKKEEAAR